MPRIQLVLFALLLAGIVSSCNGDGDIYDAPDAVVDTSVDTLTFDTVFTTLGSAYRTFMIHNPYDQPLAIDRIELSSESYFRMNVDGFSGRVVENLEIAAKDSAFVFVEVTVDPVNQSNPLVIYDSILFVVNGGVQHVILEAWGQDAYYYYPDTYIQGLPPISFISSYEEYFPISDNITLPNDKPHVIFGYLHIDSATTVNIQPGTQIHLQKGAGLWSYREASIQAIGTREEPIEFKGLRLEPFFDDIPGQWDRIWINESQTPSRFEHVSIRNGFVGIQAEPWPFSGPVDVNTQALVISNSIIENMEGVGLLTRHYAVDISNSLIDNCKEYLLASLGGGEQSITHTTMGNYWSRGARPNPSILLSNGFVDAFGNSVFGDLTVRFQNSIVYGTSEEELQVDTTDVSGFDILFDHCVVRTQLPPSDRFRFNENVMNPSNSGFVNPSRFDYHITSDAPARGIGDPQFSVGLDEDLDGEQRSNPPDAGAYTYIE